LLLTESPFQGHRLIADDSAGTGPSGELELDSAQCGSNLHAPDLRNLKRC